MAWASVSYIFSPSTVIRSSEVNQNFSDLVAGLDKAMPSGGIIIWSGAIADVPSGWFLCDGNNGTPNLRDRFVVGAGSTYAVGSSGGSATINIAHTHAISSDGGHAHNYSGTTGGTFATDIVRRGSGDPFNLSNETHTHSYSGTTDTQGVHSHGGATGTNLSATQSILPPYFALAYIMKS